MTAVATKVANPRFTKTQAKRLFDQAFAAGEAALAAATPVPMIVGSPSTPLGSDVDPTKPMYFVEGGLCGFAWVVVEPGTSSFGRWLLATGRGTKAYGGGVQIRVRQGGQSIARKEAFAGAMAGVLREAGVKAFAESRLD